MTVTDNVAYGLMVRKVRPTSSGHASSEGAPDGPPRGYGRRRPGQLSGGQLQRVALARAIVNRPQVLLPRRAAGRLDIKLRQQMQLELKAIEDELGITFIYVTHDEDEALAMSDAHRHLRQGRIEQVGTPAEVYERPRTAFVAGFVSTSNVLTGSVAAEIAGRAGTYTVRPEKIHLGPAGRRACRLGGRRGWSRRGVRRVGHADITSRSTWARLGSSSRT
ncbi:MAG: hypothetical protein R3C32_03835 [Chloroflexota bacterium]